MCRCLVPCGMCSLLHLASHVHRSLTSLLIVVVRTLFTPHQPVVARAAGASRVACAHCCISRHACIANSRPCSSSQRVCCSRVAWACLHVPLPCALWHVLNAASRITLASLTHVHAHRNRWYAAHAWPERACIRRCLVRCGMCSLLHPASRLHRSLTFMHLSLIHI